MTAIPLTRLHTDTARIPVINGEVLAETWEIPAPWMRPPVTTTYRRESRLARRARIFRVSPFARHVTALALAIVDSTWFIAWTVAAGIGLAALFLGFHELAESFFRALGR